MSIPGAKRGIHRQSGDATGPEWTYDYDHDSNLITVTSPDPDGPSSPGLPSVTTYEYDALSRMVQETDPEGIRMIYTYDDLGRRITSSELQATETAGSFPEYDQTVYTYDNVGNLLTMTGPTPDGSTVGERPETVYTYDAWNRLTAIQEPENSTSEVTEYTYDDVGNVLVEENPLGETMTYIYDDLDRLIQVEEVDPNDPQTKLITRYTYDLMDRQLTMSQLYDAGSDPVSEADDLYYVTTYIRDNLGRVISEEDPNGGLTEYTYDTAGRLLTLTDPGDGLPGDQILGNRNVTTWSYDAEGRVLTEQNQLGKTRTIDYDALGRLVWREDRNGRIRTFEYDDLDRLTMENWFANATEANDPLATPLNTINWEYDLNSQVTSADDDDSDYDFDYDVRGRLDYVTTELNGNTVVKLDYDYDRLNRRTETVATFDTTADFTNTYEYDKAGRVVSLRQFGTTGNTVGEKRVGITYDPLSRFETITRYEDFLDAEMVATSTYGFDSAGRLDSLTHVGPGSESLADYTYTHDKLGRILTFDLTSAERPNDDESATYTYDATNQLTDADYDYQDDEDYDYDLNGNRINNAFESGTNNQHYSDGRYTYEYDDEGNRIRKYALHVLATGADQGGGPHVLVHDGSVPTRPEIGSFYAYNPAFTGGVRVAVGDVTGDGIPDIITSPGTGGNVSVCGLNRPEVCG